MRNVSNKYIETMRTRRDFYAVAEITFADGVQKALNKEDFILSGNSIAESAESSSFPLGILAAKRITISLMNDDDRWSSYAFYGARIFLQTKFDLDDGTTETLNIGTFTVITPENYGTTISITAMDDSYKTDIPYSTSLAFPVSAGEALRESCGKCGISLRTTSFPNDNYVINTAPKDITHRQFIGMVAMIAGGNAVFDEYNRLMIKPYDFSGFETMSGEYGGIFDNLSEERYLTGDNINGGVFEPWDVGDVEDPVFSDLDRVHFLYDFEPGITVESDDVVITGVQITSTDENNNEVVHLFGEEGYVLSLENQLAAGKEDEAIRLIGQSIVGLRFRPFSGNHIAYPMAEFMDLAYLVDRLGRAYQTVLTDVNFNYYGFTSLKCSADSPIRNSSKYYSNETRAIVEARYMFEREKTDRERAIEELAKELSQSGGLFMTTEPQADGSFIYYMHDKPSREESMVIWKLTANAFAISTDGGKSYPYGINVTGMAILDRIYTIGLNADYVKTGSMSADLIKGGTLILGGNNNVNGLLKILDSNGAEIGKWDKDGIDATVGIFRGSIINQNGNNKITIENGTINYYYSNLFYGRVTPIYQDNGGRYFSLLGDSENCGAVSIGIGRTGYIFVNNGLNPNGQSERVQISDSARFFNKIYFGADGQDAYLQCFNNGDGIFGVYCYDYFSVKGKMFVGNIDYGPSYSLHVTGSGYFTADITVQGKAYFDNGICNYDGQYRIPIGTTKNHYVNCIDMYSNYITVMGYGGTQNISFNSSDKRLKSNILPTKVNALNVINKIQMYEFDFQWKESNEHQTLGFIADELEKIDPKFTIGGGYDENGNINIKSVNVFYLVGYLTKSIQEMSEIVNEQKNKISSLEQRLEKLEQLIGGE